MTACFHIQGVTCPTCAIYYPADKSTVTFTYTGTDAIVGNGHDTTQESLQTMSAEIDRLKADNARLRAHFQRLMSLSDRLRPDCEAAPWVIKEVKKLEAENARLKEALAWYGQEWLYDMKEFLCAAPLSVAGELPKQETIQGNPIQHDRGKLARAALEWK